MEYRLLGGAGLMVSILSYGASSLGGHFRSIREAFLKSPLLSEK